MRTTSEVPADFFPLHKELLGQVDEPGLLGSTARLLAAGVVGYVAPKPQATAAIIRLCHAPAGVSFPLLAGLEPFGKVWVECAWLGGERRGILAGTLRDGSVWTRSVRRDGAGPVRCLPFGMRRLGKARRTRTDWTAIMEGRWTDSPAADERWTRWAKRKLSMELFDPDVTPAEGLQLFCGVGLNDLTVLAAATSPRFMPDIASVVRAARH
ncbi:hypothetical protein QMO56_18350 [Roseomonas sp. E05]|uniref:hypothetical protein n=1 Tax=Roseomonas sp. E05 TaxID=3046310 RepID=UPI0024BAFB65|nr:hypothetical protein [Roseomonas sp. E05]MDJ0390074.1 hypothetical protein [Roseomonas sp. E05]